MAALFYSRGGVPVHADYKENIIIDPDHPILIWKANKDRLRPDWFTPAAQRDFPEGLPKIGSQHSEDALTWNVFRTLQINDRIQRVTDVFVSGLGVYKIWFWGHDATPSLPQGSIRLSVFVSGLGVYKIWFWGHDADLQTQEIDPEIQQTLNRMEPWGKDGVKQQTEPDVILRGKSHIVMVECKLGKPAQKIKAWQRGRQGMRPEYLAFMNSLRLKLFADSFDYERHGNRFYQLFRNYLLGAALASRWQTKFSLLAIVNELNSNLEGQSHEDEFDFFRSLLVDPSNTHLVTWQQICGALSVERDLVTLSDFLAKHPLLSP